MDQYSNAMNAGITSYGQSSAAAATPRGLNDQLSEALGRAFQIRNKLQERHGLMFGHCLEDARGEEAPMASHALAVVGQLNDVLGQIQDLLESTASLI